MGLGSRSPGCCTPGTPRRGLRVPCVGPSLMGSAVPWELCPHQIKKYEKLDSEEERASRSRHIFDHYIMKELLACSHVSAVLWGITPPFTQPCMGPVPPARLPGVTRSRLAAQPFSKSATEHVQSRLSKKQVPPDLFQVGSAGGRGGGTATSG